MDVNTKTEWFPPNLRFYLVVRTCELILCFPPFVILAIVSIFLTSLFPLFYVTRRFYRFLHRG